MTSQETRKLTNLARNYARAIGERFPSNEYQARYLVKDLIRWAARDQHIAQAASLLTFAREHGLAE